MTSSEAKPYLVDEFTHVLKVYSDGSIWRPTKHGSGFDNIPILDDGSVLWKDLVFDESNHLQLRIFKPASPISSKSKLPVLYYFHAGGFCHGSRSRPKWHNYCFKLALELQAMIVCPDYRLAPENRLPAAIEDGFTSVEWLQYQAMSSSDQSDAWLVESADFSRVFIIGDSSGGNIAHHIAVQLGAGLKDLKPVQVRGYVLLDPFFGGIELTKSEADVHKEAIITWEVIDRLWRLSLPVGETRDHPIVNPFGPHSLNLEPVDLDPILVVSSDLDALKDRAKDYAERLKSWKKKAEYVEFEGQHHGFFTKDPDCKPAIELLQMIKEFIAKYSC